MSYVLAGRSSAKRCPSDDDDETLPELMGDLAVLEHDFDKEIQKLHRAKELVSLSRRSPTRERSLMPKQAFTAD